MTAAVPTLQFDELKHIYREGDQIVPSLTQILTLAGLSDYSMVPQHILDRAAAIGTAVHQACEFLDQDDLNLDALDPLIVPFVCAYRKFKESSGFTPKLIEHRAVGELGGLRFGFCADRTGVIDGEEFVLELKTSSMVKPDWAIQTAGQCVGLGTLTSRAAVQLKKDSTYVFVRHDNGEDYGTFAAALRIAHWKLAHGSKLK